MLLRELKEKIMKYSDYKAYQTAEWLGKQEHKVFSGHKTKLYTADTPKNDTLNNLILGFVIGAMVAVCGVILLAMEVMTSGV